MADIDRATSSIWSLAAVVGSAVGARGADDGCSVGVFDGWKVGWKVGWKDGCEDGEFDDGCCEADGVNVGDAWLIKMLFLITSLLLVRVNCRATKVPQDAASATSKRQRTGRRTPFTRLVGNFLFSASLMLKGVNPLSPESEEQLLLSGRNSGAILALTIICSTRCAASPLTRSCLCSSNRSDSSILKLKKEVLLCSRSQPWSGLVTLSFSCRLLPRLLDEPDID